MGRADGSLIEAMNSIQAHRGPDGAGVQVFPAADGSTPVALGHRRLSIIDPSERGAQPMAWADGRYWITYNGELYNFKSLRSELKADGVRFATECDTEVLLAMYEAFGPRMLERLNGIFAFAIWDSERDRLFLARDRLGVKPLYYSRHDGVFYFASEVKALLHALPRPSLRHDALPQYLTFLWVPEPETLFDGIRKLPPGHRALVANGRLEIEQYWDMSFVPGDCSREEQWVRRMREEVESSVERQMVSDVPIGAFLSGGLDSSSIVESMRRVTDDVTTYSIGFAPDDQRHEIAPDDLQYARRLAAELGVENNERVLDPGVVDLLPTLVWHLDEPIADPAAITTYLICSAAREQLTVVLSGMGADEMLAGYPRHLAAGLTRHLDLIPARARRALRSALDGRLTMGPPGRMRTVRRNALEVLRGLDQPALRRYLYFSAYYRPEQLRELLAPDLRELAGSDPFATHAAHAERVAGEHWLNRLLYVDMKTFLPALNLNYTDKMSMAASTEVRVPLLDDRLVSLIGAIPANLKLHGRERKYVLKRAMEDRLPAEVIWRPKAGFGAPIRSWLVGGLKPMVDELLSPAAVARRGLFEPSAVQRLLRENERGTADRALQIWTLLVLEIWQQTFVDAGGGGPVVTGGAQGAGVA